MSDVWKIAAKINASDMYQITKSMLFGSEIMAANRLTNMCNQMSSSYDQILDDQNEYITEIDAQINEIETLQKELDAKIKEQEAERNKILSNAGNDGLSEEDEAKVNTINSEIEALNGDANAKIGSISSDIKGSSSKLESTVSKADAATDYGNTAVEKGTPLANTKDKRKSFWRKLSGSWNKSAEREAGKKAVEAGNNLLDKVETVKASEKEITKKTKKYNQ